MLPKYKKILKELKKGNSVLAEVSLYDHCVSDIRYRIITPISCEYANIDVYVDFLGDKQIKYSAFNISCFIRGLSKKEINPDLIVSRMMAYDYYTNSKVMSFVLLK